MKKDGRSQFVIRKYVMAHSAQEAIKLDRKTPFMRYGLMMIG